MSSSLTIQGSWENFSMCNRLFTLCVGVLEKNGCFKEIIRCFSKNGTYHIFNRLRSVFLVLKLIFYSYLLLMSDRKLFLVVITKEESGSQ